MQMIERQQSEQVFHDRQAEERAEFYRLHRSDLIFSDEAYLHHETWIQPAFARLGDLRGKDVLDYGCGHGMASVVMARHGARVTGFDLSAGYLTEARQRAAANQVEVHFLQADAEHLPFAEASFDAVWGCAILHHLDLAQAARELRRVLRPGGVAVFCEPWGENRLLNLARKRMPYPGKQRTRDERPLLKRDLRPLHAVFPRLEIHGFQLFGMLRRALRRQPRPGDFLDRCDTYLLHRFPYLENWCRYVVLTLQRDVA